MAAVEKCIKRPGLTITPVMSVLEAAEEMSRQHVGAFMVVEGSKLLGILSERDIITRVVAKRKDPATTKVSEVMTKTVRTVVEQTSTDEAIGLMYQNDFRHLPVLEKNGKVIGMLSVRDLLRQRIEELSLENKDLLAYMAADGPGG